MKNNKGFTLIELMVVVGIIGIITGIAVPSFQRFTARAKQANARTELSAIYGMEKAFFTEFGGYHNNLTVIGYAPDGVPLLATGCLDRANFAQWPVRYYRVGFPNAAEPNVPGLPNPLPCAGLSFDIDAKPNAAGILNAGLNPNTFFAGVGIDNTVAPALFTVGAIGRIGGQQDDLWTINQNKLMVNAQIGY